MKTEPEVIALIPLRGGSKSIPKKNIHLLAGKPLCMYAIEAAAASGVFSRIIVSTDSYEIASVVTQHPELGIEVLMRPDELATDTASTEGVMLHAMHHNAFDVLCTIQVTSPLVSPDDFRKAYNKYQIDNADSMLTAVRTKRFFWTPEGEPINYDPMRRPRRQDFEGYLMENGAFYFTSRRILEQLQCRLGGNISIYEMDESTALEIDEPQDWTVIEQIIRAREMKQAHDSVAHIRLAVTDIDGTMTDAGMYYTAEGDFMKRFNTRDAKGLELIRDMLGIRIMILTREDIEIVRARARKLKIEDCYTGVKDKLTFLEDFLRKEGIAWHETAFFGDDLNDLECMERAGFAACPQNAEDEIKSVSHYIASERGGEGAVRDICNFMLRQPRKASDE